MGVGKRGACYSYRLRPLPPVDRLPVGSVTGNTSSKGRKCLFLGALVQTSPPETALKHGRIHIG